MDSSTQFCTADLCDAYGDTLHVVAPVFRDFGSVSCFSGRIATVCVREDNALVRRVLSEAGDGRVLVIDGHGSLQSALVGSMLARLAHANGWSGVVINGCVRDAAELSRIPIAVRALATHPMRSAKTGAGEREIAVSFASVTFTPGHFLYADHDGMLVSDRELVLR